MAVNSERFLPSGRGGALATTKPTATLVPYKKPAGGDLVKKPTEGDGEDEKSSLEDDVAEIRVKTKKIEKIIGRTLKFNKKTQQFEARQAEKDNRAKEEDKKEKKKGKGIKLPKIKLPKVGFFQKLKDFFGTILIGRLLYLLVDLAPKIAGVVKFFEPILKFIGDVVAGLADKIVTAITFGYKVKDKVEEVTKNLFGDEGLETFKSFQGHFTKFMNLALIALMVAATTAADTGYNRGRDRGAGRDLSGRRTRRSVQQRYRRRFGDRRFAERFGRKNLRRLDKGSSLASRGSRAAQSGAQKFVQKSVTKVAGKAVGKIAGKIPIVGPLIDFGVRAFILKEPLGKAAAGAVGAGVGQALGTFLGGAIGGIVGSVVPFVGNLLVGGAGATIGGLIGGVIGDQIGVSLYNVISGGEDSGAAGEAGLEAKKKGGVVGEEEYEDEMKKRARNARIKRIMPSRDSHMTVNKDAAEKAKGKKGSIFNRLFSFMSNVAENVSPFKKIKDAVKKLRSANSSIISKIMALGADLLAGKKPDNKAIKDIVASLVSFFDAAVPAPVNLIRNLLQKLAGGGYIIETPQQQKKRVRNLTRIVEQSFLTEVGRDTTQALNVIKGIEGKKQEIATGPRSPTTGGGTTPLIPGARLPSAGATLAGSDKLAALTGQSGTVAYDGREGAALNISYSPFAASDLAEQAGRGGIVITSGKGYRRSTGSNHKGYDVGADPGTPMYAYLDGEVVDGNNALGGANDGGYGYWIMWKDSVHNAYHFFGHLDRPPALSVGAKFKAGALLGNVGGSGSGSLTRYDPHLHWEIANSQGAFGINGGSGTLDPGQWINTHGANKTPTVTTTNPTNDADAVSDQAGYEKDGTTVAVVEKVEYVRVRVGTNARGRAIYKNVPKDQQVVSPT